jgi:hypothetical protein
MKKIYLLMAAASAIMLTACSSEDDVVQSAAQQANTTQAVGFDVFTQNVTNVTRAGLEGTMTTSRLQRSEYEGGGFGVYAFLTHDEVATAGVATGYASTDPTSDANIPNFMINEKILWNAENQGWYYNPLKYWPNETDNDSQTSAASMLGDAANTHTDRLTFFAYAPYVPTTTSTSVPGITAVTKKDGLLGTANTSDPTIAYMASTDDPNEAVDLLWGVAPAGGLSYTAVNGTTVNVSEGLPLIDMTKPNINTNMKFLFQHALARIGVTAVAAIDQVGAGGKLDPNTKITIEKITMEGYFGRTGDLNLNNSDKGPGVANWISANGKAIKTATLETATATDLTKTKLTLTAKHGTTPGTDSPDDGTIATHLQFVGTPGNAQDPVTAPVEQENRVGVTTVRQNVIQPALINNADGANRNWYTTKTYAVGKLAYSETTPYYSDKACTTLYGFNMPATYTVNSKGEYTEVAAISDNSFKYPKVLQNYKQATEFTKVVAADVTNKTYDNYQAYTKSGDDYYPKAGIPEANDYVVASGLYFYQLVDANKDNFKGQQLYEKNGSTFKPKAVGTVPAAGDYVLCGNKTLYVPTNEAEATVYKRDANYFMVVPTNNFKKLNAALDDEKLRTVRVQIWYYITTEDSELNAKRAQTKNVITKDVVFPSIANGKSYNLNLVLGLTSVKMEAEVDDWKVINVQGDLPQNTAE